VLLGSFLFTAFAFSNAAGSPSDKTDPSVLITIEERYVPSCDIDLELRDILSRTASASGFTIVPSHASSHDFELRVEANGQAKSHNYGIGVPYNRITGSHFTEAIFQGKVCLLKDGAVLTTGTFSGRVKPEIHLKKDRPTPGQAPYKEALLTGSFLDATARVLTEPFAKPPCSALAALLKHPDVDVRDAAIDAVTREQDDSADRLLRSAVKLTLVQCKALDKKDWSDESVRRASRLEDHTLRTLIRAIGRKKDINAIDQLIDLLNFKDTRCSAALALANIGDTKATVPILRTLERECKTTKDCGPDADELIRSLGHLGDARAADYLLTIARDGDWPTSENAAEALGSIASPKTVLPLVNILRNSQSSAKDEVALALGKIGDFRATAPLLATLKEADPGSRSGSILRLYVVKALGDLGDKTAVNALLSALSQEPSSFNTEIIIALGKLKDPRVIPLLEKRLNSKYEDGLAAAGALYLLSYKKNVMRSRVVAGIWNLDGRFALRLLALMKDPRTIPSLLEKLEKCGPKWTEKGVIRTLEAVTGKSFGPQYDQFPQWQAWWHSREEPSNASLSTMRPSAAASPSTRKAASEKGAKDNGQDISDAHLRQNASYPRSLPPFTQALKGRNEVRVKNPNDFKISVGLRRAAHGRDFDVPANGSASIFVPDGHFNIYFVYSSKPDSLFQGDNFTLKGNGVEIQIVKVVGGNYSIKQIK